MTKTTAEALKELEDYLAEEGDALGEMIAEICEGGDIDILDSHTLELIENLFNSMPESDSMTTEDIIRHIREVGTPFALTVAQDIISSM